MTTVLRELFGPGTWGTAGNLVASALLTVPALVISHVKAARQRDRHHEELKKTIGDNGSEGR
jgi:hypothetical protein